MTWRERLAVDGLAWLCASCRAVHPSTDAGIHCGDCNMSWCCACERASRGHHHSLVEEFLDDLGDLYHHLRWSRLARRWRRRRGRARA